MEQLGRSPGADREYPAVPHCKYRGCSRLAAGEATFVMERGMPHVVPLCRSHAAVLAYGAVTDAELLTQLEP